MELTTTKMTIHLYNTLQYFIHSSFESKGKRLDIAERYSGFTNKQLKGVDVLWWYDNNINIYTQICTYWYMTANECFLLYLLRSAAPV